ncbi:hypothetical protein BH09MYX1_BH09MYX1_14440 [soil metagenome]
MRPIVTTRQVPPHITRASAGVRGVLTAVCAGLLFFPWHQASGEPVCSGATHYGLRLPILLLVVLVSVLFARVSLGRTLPWCATPIALASGIVTTFAAAAALSITADGGHATVVTSVGKAADLFRSFQWVLVALGMWQIYLHGSAALRR